MPKDDPAQEGLYSDCERGVMSYEANIKPFYR